MFLGSWKTDDLLTFTVNTQTTAGVAADADSPPTYRVYEDETGTPLLTGSMALLDGANTAGFYSEQIALSAATGFEKGKCYTIRIEGTVGGTTGTTLRSFQIEAEVDANTVSGAVTVGTNNDKTGYALAGTERVKLHASQPDYTPAKAGDAMTLTPGERTAVADAVETQIIDDTDSEKVLQAIVDKIAAVNPSLDDLTLGSIATAVREEVERVGGLLALVKAVTDQVDPLIAGGALTEAAVANVPAAVNTLLETQHGTGPWGPGETMGANDLVVTAVDDTTEEPLPDVQVTIRTAAGTLRGQKRTDADGQYAASLADGEYTAAANPLPGYNGVASLAFSLPGDTAVELRLLPIPVAAPSAPGLCRVYGYFYQNGEAVEGADVSATLSGLPQTTSSVILSGERRTNTTDPAGYWYLDLVKGKTYAFTLEEAGIELRSATVPNEDTVDFRTLIV